MTADSLMAIDMANLNVLIVDDDPIFVMMHKLKVKMSSIADNPQTHHNGKSALESIIGNNEEDASYLIFLDINMPVMSGWDLLNALQVSPLATKVFVALVTSSVDKRDRERAKRYPQVIGFYEKALNADTCFEIKTNPAIAHFFANDGTFN